MRLLISNDDGIYSPGILALAEVAAEFGSVRIVAPDAERSSTGHAITSSRPLAYHRVRIGAFEAYRVNGTPADCVALGANRWGEVDVVLSGINIGFNLGNGLWHSGTLAAAKQATLLGLQGVAFSAPATVDSDYEPFKPWVRRAIETVITDRIPSLVNVNIPRTPKGMMWTRVSVRRYDGRIVPTTDPLGREMFWFSVGTSEGAEEGTDRWAIEQAWVSLTPLSLDLTDAGALAEARQRRPLDEAIALAVSPARSHPDVAKSVREDEADPVMK